MEPTAVLAEYPSLPGLSWVALGTAGGLSGARIWQGRSSDDQPVLCLKAWQPDYSATRLSTIHLWMRHARHRCGLAFVPDVLANQQGNTVTRYEDRIWDLTTWMPGTADFHAHPSPQRLTAAMTALAALHRAWHPRESHAPQWVPCPGVVRRFEILTQFTPPREIPSHLIEAVALLRSHVPVALALLEPWRTSIFPIQPCLCDPRHDHLLFTGDTLTGLVDFGAAKWDHPAVDLARILDEFACGDDRLFDDGIVAYRASGGPVAIPTQFVHVLAYTGLVCAVIGWWERLTHTISDGVGFARWEWLLTRLQSAHPPRYDGQIE